MNLELQIPEEAAHLLTSEYADLPRAAVEALALEGYRSKRFSEGQLRQMLAVLVADAGTCVPERTWRPPALLPGRSGTGP